MSGALSANAKARLISPDVQVTPTSRSKCLTFWYNMYGRQVYRLSVYVKAGNTLPSQPLWRKSGTQGTQWKQQTLTVSSVSVFNVSVNNLYLFNMALIRCFLVNMQGEVPSPLHVLYIYLA